jgi:hypothetical protein
MLGDESIFDRERPVWGKVWNPKEIDTRVGGWVESERDWEYGVFGYR